MRAKHIVALLFHVALQTLSLVKLFFQLWREPKVRLFEVPSHCPGCSFSVSLAERIENLSMLSDGFGRDARVEVETVEMHVCVNPFERVLEKHIAAYSREDIVEGGIRHGELLVFLIGLSNPHFAHLEHELFEGAEVLLCEESCGFPGNHRLKQ
jgi:hypothetical protein